jgi:hypothetical protein
MKVENFMSKHFFYNDQKHVVFFVVTNHSINLDERISKEIKSLSNLGCTCEIIATEYSNKARRGFTESGVPFRALRLLTRMLLPRTKFKMVKAIELNIRMIMTLSLKKADCLWVVDHHCAGMIIYGWFRRFFRLKSIVVWDQHELISKRHMSSTWYQWLIDRCRWIIHANQARAEVLQASLKHGYNDRLLVIENFPWCSDVHKEVLTAPTDFVGWLSGSAYCLFQGGAYRHRAFFECAEAIMDSPMLKMLVLGPMPDDVKIEVSDRWPDYRNKIWVTGWVPPSVFNKFIDKALLTLVFYEPIDLNHWLCAPNRFYYALCRGIPVVCGPNPTMKAVVDKYRIGISCRSKVANSNEIIDAIHSIAVNPVIFREKAKTIKDKFFWNSQDGSFKKIYDSMN